jgi:predicted dehydrogenase
VTLTIHNEAVQDDASQRAPNSREILIAGVGSIGRRHLANLQALGWTRVRLLRRPSSVPAGGDLTPYPIDHDLDAALARRPLAVVVSNPTALHMSVALAAARAGAHLLIEKPISDQLEGVSRLEQAAAAAGLTVLVGFQFRFNPGLRRIKAWIDDGAIGDVVSAQVHWGEHLPGMHPWEDYRFGYAARSDLGGGVVLTFCHPFDYLSWLIGEIDQVSAVQARCNPFGLGVDTCVEVTLGFACGASGHVHLDFVQQPPEHRLTIVGTRGTITWSQDDHAARRYCPIAGRWETVAAPDGFNRNRMFLEEMRHFLACVRGDERPLCTLREGREALRLALTARQSMAGSPVALRTL